MFSQKNASFPQVVINGKKFESAFDLGNPADITGMIVVVVVV